MPQPQNSPNAPSQNAQLLHRIVASIPANPTHPAQVALRTYCLSLCLSLGPSLVPFVIFRRSEKTSRKALKRVLAREFGLKGFAFSVTLALGGGSFIREVFRQPGERGCGETKSMDLRAEVIFCTEDLPLERDIFLCGTLPSPGGSSSLPIHTAVQGCLRLQNAGSHVATSGARARRGRSVSGPGHIPQTAQQRISSALKRESLRTQIDSFVFWACSCKNHVVFLLPAAEAPEITLRAIRAKEWSYIKGSPSQSQLLRTYAQDLGHPAAWGDPAALPAYGGAQADKVWKQFGLTGRSGVGGLPCQMVHGEVGSSLGLEHSCTANAGLRGIKVLLEAIAIYLPPSTRPPRAYDACLESLLGALRSATFLTTFVTSYWYSVCITRSLVFARPLPLHLA
ncbi:integral membrane protein [Mycena metata]|uniref:Integral membrane protein n=1 Tax=Mycena metata TaxID=1033252 RepID=A0AAD7KJK0_9AGAR|nr:integral membrane protein [Mycena metata]